MKNINWKSVILTLLSIGCVCFIFGNSLQVADVSSQKSSIVVDVISKILAVFSVELDSDTLTTIVRKGAHFSEYLLLASLICGACLSRKKKLFRNILNIMFMVLFTAVIDENIQKFVAGRSGEVRDVLIDFSGGLSGFLIVFLVSSIRRKH